MVATPVVSSDHGSPIHTFTATATPICPEIRGARALADQINADSTADLASWRKQLAGYGYDRTGAFDRFLSTRVNVDGLVVAQSHTIFDLGGAHPGDMLQYVVLNTDTGRLVSKQQIVSELGSHGASQQKVLSALQRAAQATVDAKGVTFPTEGSLALADVNLWPGQSGLHGSIDMGAYYPDAAGTIEFTVPWSALIPAGANLSFLPDRWGH